MSRPSLRVRPGLRRRAVACVLAAMTLAGVAQPAGAIVGGTEDESFARHGLMVLSDRGGVCTGIVVAPDAVLTAAHCGSGPASLRVHFREGGEPVLLEPVAVVRHPGYVAGAVAARKPSVDLMLVRLARPLPARFAPALLDAGPQPRAGETIRIAGFGASREGDPRSTGTLRAADLPVTEPYGPGKLLLWAQRRGAGACQGDSGGPMLRDATAQVVAVTAFAGGAGGAGCGSLTQGVLVAPQRAWIDRTLQGWGRAARWSD